MDNINNLKSTPPTQVMQYCMNVIPLTSDFYIFTKADDTYRCFWYQDGNTKYLDITRTYTSGVGYTWTVTPVEDWSTDKVTFNVADPMYCYSNVQGKGIEPSQRVKSDTVQSLALCFICAFLALIFVFKGVFTLWTKRR